MSAVNPCYFFYHLHSQHFFILSTLNYILPISSRVVSPLLYIWHMITHNRMKMLSRACAQWHFQSVHVSRYNKCEDWRKVRRKGKWISTTDQEFFFFKGLERLLISFWKIIDFNKHLTLQTSLKFIN